MTARLYQFEEAVAARRPRRAIGEACVRDGLVLARLPERMTPDQADAWADHLRLLARAAREGVE